MHVTLQYCAKEEGLKQKKISIFSKFHKENNRNNKSVLTFLIFYLLCSSFFYSYFTFHKEALSFIMFILSLCSNITTFGKHIWIIRQKTFLKNAHFKIWSGMIVFTHLFFLFFILGDSNMSFRQGWVHPGMKFYLGKNV